MGLCKAEKRRVMATPQIDIARKRPNMDLDPPKIHSMHTRLDYFTQQSEKIIRILTEELKSIDQIIPRSIARSSQEDTSDESSDEECTQEDQTLKEVRQHTEDIASNICCMKDTKKPAAPDECITSIIIATRHLATKTDRKIVIYVAGGIRSVENCTKMACNDRIVISVKTVWIYNKQFRTEIEQLWRESTLDNKDFLPHVAFAVGKEVVQINPMSDKDYPIVFQSLNIEFIHKIVIIDHQKKNYWEVRTKNKESVSMTKMFSIQGSIQDFEDDAKACSKASFFLDKNRSSISRTRNRTTQSANTSQQGNSSLTQNAMDGADSDSVIRPSIIATMSFTKIVDMSRRAIILSLGSQSKFVTAQPTGAGKMVMDAKKLVWEFRQNYEKNTDYVWGVATCELDGTLDELKSLEAFIKSQWVVPPRKTETTSWPKEDLDCLNKQISDIACHTLYLDTGIENFVPHSFESITTRRFKRLKRRRKDGDCHIECYSHLAREEALHGQLLENETYRSDWEKEKDFDEFCKNHYSNLSDHTIKCVSFKYPTIRFGFQDKGSHAIFFQNSFEDTKHHKFVSKIDHEPRKFNYIDYKELLRLQWSKRCSVN